MSAREPSRKRLLRPETPPVHQTVIPLPFILFPAAIPTTFVSLPFLHPPPSLPCNYLPAHNYNRRNAPTRDTPRPMLFLPAVACFFRCNQIARNCKNEKTEESPKSQLSVDFRDCERRFLSKTRSMLDVNLEDNYYVMYHLHLVFKSRRERAGIM